MLFRFRRRYKLPRFPDTVIPTFRKYCEDLPTDQIPEIVAILKHNVNDIRAQSRSNPNVDITKVEKISAGCLALLEAYESLDERTRAMAVGAVRYFVRPDDPLSDEKFASGLDDDCQVLNHVLEQAKIENLFIQL